MQRLRPNPQAALTVARALIREPDCAEHTNALIGWLIMTVLPLGGGVWGGSVEEGYFLGDMVSGMLVVVGRDCSIRVSE